jgi:hypothetical protein
LSPFTSSPVTLSPGHFVPQSLESRTSQDHPKLKLSKMTQEIGFIESKDAIDFSGFPIGSVLFLFPFHACATAALFPVNNLYIIRFPLQSLSCVLDKQLQMSTLQLFGYF